jgi:hypothetical protein
MQSNFSTVRLLVSRARTWTAELLWLASSVVGNQERSVVLDKCLLQLVLRVLVDEFLVVRYLYCPLLMTGLIVAGGGCEEDIRSISQWPDG